VNGTERHGTLTVCQELRGQLHALYQNQLAATLWWFMAAPKPLKYKFWGSPSP